MTAQSTPPEQQFDFWLGEWDVSWGEGQGGTNRVDKILDGKVIREFSPRTKPYDEKLVAEIEAALGS